MSSNIVFDMPTDEELRVICSKKWEASGPFNIDQWPADVLALSIPTKFIPITDIDQWQRIWNADISVMQAYADLIDEAIGWDGHFIRLNSRSPKDAAYPALPITCSGKQAMAWIASSERCMSDTSLHRLAGKPLFICAREWRPIRPQMEFRCFAKDGDMIAVSRYDYHSKSIYSDEQAPSIFNAAKQFYDDHLKAHYNNVVFDLHAPGTDSQLLIELNPYGMSDPCLFRSYDMVVRGGIMLGDMEPAP